MNPSALIQLSLSRHTCKAFDASKKIPSAELDALLNVLRNAPSSVNAQPWHFVLAQSDAGKAQLIQGLQGEYMYNAPKVQNASHALVLCRRTDLDEAYLETLLDQEDKDGRFAAPADKDRLRLARGGFVGMHRKALNDVEPWMEKQVYIALGMLLQAAAALGIDSCPMEGFNAAALDEALNLQEKNLTSVVMVALGYRSTTDFNASLRKSRLPDSHLFTQL